MIPKPARYKYIIYSIAKEILLQVHTYYIAKRLFSQPIIINSFFTEDNVVPGLD